MSAERENLTWENYGTAARDLAKIVANDNYQPDIILAIARGVFLLLVRLATPCL